MSTDSIKFNAETLKKYIPFFDKIKQASEDSQVNIYIVGGTVRDILMERPISDIDIVPFGMDYEVFAKLLSKKLNSVAIQFKDNVRLVKGNIIIDVSKPRGQNISEDIKVRDFTINNLAMTMDGLVIGDTSDIDNRIIRVAYEHSFIDDPIRILRAFRFVSTLGFEIEPHTLEKAMHNSFMLLSCAAERVLDEFKKLFAGDNIKHALNLVMKANLFDDYFKSEFDYLRAVRLKEDEENLGGNLIPCIICGCVRENAIKAAENLKMSDKDIKHIKLLKDAEREIEETDDNVRKMRLFAYKFHENLNEVLSYLYTGDLKTKNTAAAVCISGKSIDMTKIAHLNGAFLIKLGYKPSPIFKSILDEVGAKLALNELEENDTIKYIEENYPRN